MSRDERPPRRPALRADLPDFPGDPDPADRIALAHATAAAVLKAGHGDDQNPDTTERLVHLADEVGLDELAELWRESGPGTLPGTLWSLYLLRSWLQRNGAEASRLFTAGERTAEVSTAVAGLRQPPGPDEVAELGNAILTRAFDSDFAIALERAAAFCRVVAVGRAHVADDTPPDESDRQIRLARGNLRMADELEQAAGLWRKGELH
ncbi:hypothetical protein EF847_19870 [Actinobacteria bacterium YIM 96077]|uniref:DNA-directed RNA polymerase subunit beta n=2 Tax=Phytoactinopolyspora halophila TaxID=1981511 RepID=A0A329QNQ8_9ACTN|nr:hypothetical protein EF847_19870 [Actinobacteria bacterium YIM 96077]RAW14007.1 hypothetical protein DPM12_11265 [Phytoactinopolyspora halophila]